MIKLQHGITPLKGFKRWPKRNNTSCYPLLSSRCMLLIYLITLIYLPTANAQQKQWVMADKLFTFPAGVTGTPTSTYSFPSAGIGPTSTATDEGGNLLFYIRDYHIYNAAHEMIDPYPNNLMWPASASTTVCHEETQGDVAIVPFINEPTGCVRHFYVFYQLHNSSLQTKLTYGIISANRLTGEIKVDYYDHSQVYLLGNLVNSAYTNMTYGCRYGTGAIAVGPIKDHKRYVYYVSGYEVYKVTISESGGVNTLISGVPIITSSDSRRFHATQAVLSADGTKLAWGAHPQENPIVNGSVYYIVGLDANGNYNGTSQTLTLNESLTGTSYYGCRGVAFNANASKLFVSTGKVGNGLYVFDIPAGTYRKLPQSDDLGVSQLRLNNGLIYGMERYALKGYDPETEQLVFTDASIQTHANYERVQYLPNQVNGEYSALDITSSTTLDGSVIANVMKLNGGINVYGSGTVLTIKDMTLEFGAGAGLNLAPGTTLNLENSTLKGLDLVECLTYRKLWRGITASSTSLPITINIDPNDRVFAITIQDALVGIDAIGSQVTINMNHLKAQANETHISVRNGAKLLSTVNSSYCTFLGDQPLRDQTKGSNAGYVDGLKRTIYNIYVNNAPFPNFINGELAGGQYGIYAENPGTLLGSEPIFWNNEFNSHKQAGIYITKSKVDYEFECRWLHFNDLANGIVINNCDKSFFSIRNSYFTNVAKYGVDANNNRGCEFYIGVSKTYPETMYYTNFFTNTGKAAVYLYNNADPARAKIYISRNIISSSVDGNKGIVISESSGGDKKYSELRIDYNTISNVSTSFDLFAANKPYAIQLVNAIGGNPRNPEKRNLANYPLSHIRNNNLAVSSVLPGDQGFEIAASGGNSFFDNSINGNRYGRAIRITNSQNTLYHANTSTTGYGFLAQGSMLNSNYYCNTISKAYTGMHLRNHWLRNSYFATHGDAQTGARDNNFSQRPSGKPYSSIYLDNSQVGLNQWKFSTSWGLPVITSTGSTGIFAGYETDVCGLPGLPGGGGAGEVPSEITSPVGIFWERYGRQQQYLMGYDSFPDSNSNIVKLLDAENLISLRNDAAALPILNSIVVTPSAYDEQIMTDYKLLYQTYLAYRMADTTGRDMNDSMVAILTAIAVKDPVTQSPAAHSARAILWDERHLEFGNEPVPALILGGYLVAQSCSTSIESLPVYLVDAAGQIAEGPVFTDADGEFSFNAGTVPAYSSDNNLYKLRMILADGSIIESAAGTVNDLAMQSDHVFDCNTATAPFVIAGFVHATGCPGQVTSNIAAYLLKQNDELVDGPVMVSPTGNFSFNPVIAAMHHNSGLYKVRLIFADASVATTNAATIADLAAASVHEFNCPDEPPIILGKKGRDTDPLRYKEEPNEFAQQAPFSVSPNPSNGLFRIAGVGSAATASLTNLIGQVVLKDLPLTNGILDVTQLKAGVYLLTVSDKHNSYVQKVNITK